MKQGFDEIVIYACDGVRTRIAISETEDVELRTESKSGGKWVEESRMMIPTQRYEDIMKAIRLMKGKIK